MASSGFNEPGASAVGGNLFTAAGYIDPAIPISQFRLRFDSAYDDNRPDRAAYFYPKCGCFKVAGIDPNAPGPPKPERSVDYQELRSYLEVAVDPRFSVFAEVPVRWINPDVNDNASGIGDVNFGFKYAAIYTENTVVTGQVRAYSPTGSGFNGLGTDHWTIEPGILAYHRLTERIFLEGEFKDWVPLGGTPQAGNVLQYGIGASYLAYNSPDFRIAPVVEMVGWTVLSGQELTAEGNLISASGDTIVNAKVGVRVGFGQATQPGVLSKTDLYVGYGRALTGAVWYKDLLRVELRYRF